MGLLKKIPFFLWFVVAIGWSYKVRLDFEDTVHGPLQGQIEAKKNELESVKREIAKGEDYKRRKEGKLREIKELGEKDQSLVGKFPRSPNIPDVLKDLADVADKTGLEFTQITPGKLRRREFLVETPLEVALAGNYVQLMSFLDAISNLRRVVRVEKLQLNTPQIRGETTTIKADVTLVIYHLDETARLASAAAAAAPPATPPAASVPAKAAPPSAAAPKGP